MNDTATRPDLRPKVLLVDDMQANLSLLMRLLAENGYKVHAANSGMAALQFIDKMVPDIVLLDIRMPDMDGYEVCRRLKADERMKNVPVIFISAMDASWDKVRAFSVGAVDYVVKPVDEQEVLARVDTQVSLWSLRRNLERRVEERTAQLQTNQILLQSIIDSSGSIIYVKDPEGRYLMANQRFLDTFGRSDKELPVLTDSDLFPEEVVRAMGLREQQVIDRGLGMQTEEVLPLQGRSHTYISFRSPLRDRDGKIYAVCCTATDITTRVREEQELRELTEMLESRLSLRRPKDVRAGGDERRDQ